MALRSVTLTVSVCALVAASAVGPALAGPRGWIDRAIESQKAPAPEVKPSPKPKPAARAETRAARGDGASSGGTETPREKTGGGGFQISAATGGGGFDDTADRGGRRAAAAPGDGSGLHGRHD